MKEFQFQIREIIVELYKSIDYYNSLEGSSRNEFKLIVKASFIKQLETLNSLVTDALEKSKFLFIPVLRGSCEDLIALRYIKKVFGRKANRFVKLQITLGVNKSLTQQKLFFLKYRQYQRVLTDDDIVSIDKVKDEFKALLKSKGINGSKLPSTEAMSKAVDLNDFYEFIFRGTSDFVHFNNGILARMAWSVDSGSIRISTNNFNEYYTEFAYFYTSFVLTTFCDSFQNEIGLNKASLNLIKKLKHLLFSVHFWPELVTFEEMNLRRPQQITRVLTESYSRLYRGS